MSNVQNDKSGAPKGGRHSSADIGTARSGNAQNGNVARRSSAGCSNGKSGALEGGQQNVQKLADHIIFVGFMGSGKSSVSRRLARFENMTCIDMDIYIEREANMKIPEIFAREGEAGFRVREHDFLRGMLTHERCILSCGGGVVTNDSSRELLKQLGTVVYLKVDAEEAVSRISRPETRPLLSGSIPAAELLAARLPLYEDAADIIVNTGGRTVLQVIKVTQRLLRKAGKLPHENEKQK